MDFSEAYKYSGPAPAYSPDGRFLAAAVEYRLIIRDAESLQVTQLYSCLDRIDHFEWSANSMYVLCALYTRAIVQVWSSEQSDWSCKIDEGPAGVQGARWSPEGTAIVVSAAAGIRTTVWSLATKRCHYLPGAKTTDGKAAAFSPDGAFMAQLERAECKDRVAIYDTSSWSQVTRFEPCTSDAAEVLWSPDGCHLALVDSPLQYRVAVYTPAGQRVCEYCAYSDALGVKAASWDRSGQFLAVGSYDQKIRILTDVTWEPLLTANHPSTVGPAGGTSSDVVLYREEPEDAVQAAPPSAVPRSPSAYRETKSRYAICALPVAVPPMQPLFPDRMPVNGQGLPRLGVGLARWSPCSRYLATINDAQPCALWVWDLAAGGLSAVLLHASEVRDARWAPTAASTGGSAAPLLAAVTGSSKVYMWAGAGASVVHVPLRGFAADALAWSPHGTSFALINTAGGAFCCAYMASGA